MKIFYLYLHHVVQIVIWKKLRSHGIFCNKAMDVGPRIGPTDLQKNKYNEAGVSL